MADECAVHAVYEFASARWYDPVRSLWTLFVSRTAEADLDRALEAAQRDCRVLDIGCGTGFNLGRLQRLQVPFESYVGVDFSDAMIAIARARYASEPRATFIARDLHTASDLANRFDVVLCTWVASHLARPRDAIDVAFAALAPGGIAVILIVTRPRGWLDTIASTVLAPFHSRPVDIVALQPLPGVHISVQYACGLVTLFRLRRAG